MKALGFGLAFIQLLDIVLHVATGQAEPLRLAANAAILLWLAALAGGWLAARFWAVAGAAAVAVYLGLNALFLAQAGLTNPAQGGAPRLTLFVLVAGTAALSGALLYARRPRPA